MASIYIGKYAHCGSPVSHLNRAAVSTLPSLAMSSVIVSVAARVSTASLHGGNVRSENMCWSLPVCAVDITFIILWYVPFTNAW